MATEPVEIIEGDPPIVRRVSPTPQKKASSGIHRFTMETKLGSKPVLRCWCGGTLDMNYAREQGGTPAMTKRLSAFLDQHGACPPPERETC